MVESLNYNTLRKYMYTCLVYIYIIHLIDMFASVWTHPMSGTVNVLMTREKTIMPVNGQLFVSVGFGRFSILIVLDDSWGFLG